MKDGLNENERPLDHTNRVLAIDDDATSLFLIEQQLIDLGYEPVCAASGVEGLAILEQSPGAFGAVILDRMMPDMDGLRVATEINLRGWANSTQIIMLSGMTSQEEMREGLDVGVFYYLTKPAKVSLLQSVLAAAIKQSTQNRTLSGGTIGTATCQLIDAAQFSFRTLAEVKLLTELITNIFPDPQRALVGVNALLENAVEHGLAGIGYEKKGELLASGELLDEVNNRTSNPDLAEKNIQAKVARKDDGVYLVVTDPGDGFAWRDFMTPDQSRAATSHGRGIAQANTRSFDRLGYNAKGNQVVAFATNSIKIDW